MDIKDFQAKDIDLIEVDNFSVPAEESDTYVEDRELCARLAENMMREYCPTVERITENPAEGEAIIGYFKSGEEAFKVLLDPFEVPVMKVAFERGRLKEYILAANGLTKEEADYLSKQ